MVDTELIKRKQLFLLQARKELINYKIGSYDDFKKNHRDQKAVQKTLQEMIEICMDIGKHIIADEGFPFPEDSKGIFSVLNEKGIVSDKVLRLMQNMAGFRNIIIHLYEKIDLEIVYAVYKKHLDDFDAFSTEINKFCGGKCSKNGG